MKAEVGWLVNGFSLFGCIRFTEFIHQYPKSFPAYYKGVNVWITEDTAEATPANQLGTWTRFIYEETPDDAEQRMLEAIAIAQYGPVKPYLK